MDLKWTTQNFFPLTLSLSQNFPKIFSLSLFHLGISWALSLLVSLSLSQYSLFLPSLIFDLSIGPISHCIQLHSHPLPPPSSPSTLFESTPTYCAIHHKSEQVIHLSLSPFVPFFFFFFHLGCFTLSVSLFIIVKIEKLSEISKIVWF